MVKDESIKCIGVYDGVHLYYDGKHNEYFALTKNFRITRYPKRIGNEVGEWCERMIKAHQDSMLKEQ